MTLHPLDTPKTLDARRKLVKSLRHSGAIRTDSVEQAFLMVPRHIFVPEAEVEMAYSDQVIALKFEGSEAISSSSQPGMMAIMLEQLELQPGMRVLEIGAGSGFNAALMGSLVGPEGRIVSIDIDEDLIDQARQNLKAAGTDNVQLICADGAYGYPDGAPYDRIILTVAAWDITPAWRQQLTQNGRMVLPLILMAGHQISTALVNRDGVLVSVSNTACRFMSLRGDSSVEPAWDYLELADGLSVYLDSSIGVDKDQLLRILQDPRGLHPTGVSVTQEDLYEARLWWNLYEPETIHAFAEGEFRRRKVIPCLSMTRERCISKGLVSADGIALWARQQYKSLRPIQNDNFELAVRAYGPDGDALAIPLVQLAQNWQRAGRPTIDELHIAVYQRDITVPQRLEQVTLLRDTVQIAVWFGFAL